MTPEIAAPTFQTQQQGQGRSLEAQPALPGLEGVMSKGHFKQYRSPAGVHDEMFGPNGLPRPVWKNYLAALEKMDTDQIERRWEQAKRFIHENGVTYNVYGDPRGLDRPWVL